MSTRLGLTSVARVFLAALFLANGIPKLAGAERAVAAFAHLGAGQGLRLLVGAGEVTGALGLLVTPVAPLAALGLAGLMVGAILSHLLVIGGSPLPALAALGLCLFVAWAERQTFTAWRILHTGKGAMDGWVAHSYDGGIQTAFRGTFRALVQEVVDDLAGAQRILDVGCGPGQFTVLAAEELPDAHIWGVDLAPTMIELARAHAAASPAAARLHFEVADSAHLPFPDGNFDAVLSTGSIKHWPDPAAGLAEIHRVLRRDGRAFVAEINRLAPAEAVAAQRAHLRHWFFRLIYPRVFAKGLSPEEARALFVASPFRSAGEERMLLGGCLWLFAGRKTRPTG